jgi:hypothetical protein
VFVGCAGRWGLARELMVLFVAEFIALAYYPVGAVTGVTENGIQLNITKQQVKDLPSAYHRGSAPPGQRN